MKFHIGSQAPKVPPKIAISHIFVISGGNIIKCKAPQSFLFSFPGRVPVIFHWISEGLCNSSFIEEIFNIKNWKKVPHGSFLQFYETPDLGKKISKPEMSLSQKYIWLALISENFMMI